MHASRLLAAAVLASSLTPVWSQTDKDLPAAFRQVLPRGALKSIDEPGFVPASEAEIPDDAWILGVVIDGQARAYSLNILNGYEVVNDRINEQSFAAVW